ncbi:MAG: LacI family DNA-binding transcriptional regulator [Acidimicrobiales bacterium]
MARSKDPQRPNVYEVAQRAGVSIATVSRVLHGSAPVAAETRQRVLQAADELRWRPSRLARAFIQQTHDAVGIVFPDISGPYYSQVIRGFEEQAVERKCAVLILGTHGRHHADELVYDLADRVDGLLVMGRTVSDEIVQAIDRPTMPVVLLARPPVGDIPAVRAANTGSAEAVTRHLLEHGRRHLVFLGDPDLSADVRERWSGFRRALRRAGVPDVDDALVSCGGFDVDHGHKAGLGLLRRTEPLDAVVCANDEVASGVYLAAAGSGVRVPDDVAVTGWDDTAIATHLEPSLTTVRQPMQQLGVRAAGLLFDRVEGHPAASTVLRTSLVVRESCGCRRQRREPPAQPARGKS